MCFGFADVFVTGERRRRCVICQKTLSAESLKPNKIKRHLEICHADLAKQTSKCFSSKKRRNTKTWFKLNKQHYFKSIFRLVFKMPVELLNAKHSTKWKGVKFQVSHVDMFVSTFWECTAKQLSCISFTCEIDSCRCGHIMSSKWAPSLKYKKQTIWHSDEATDSDDGTHWKHISGSFINRRR